MPVTKGARIRHEIIDECLRNSMMKWTRKSLLKKVNERLLTTYETQGISPSMLRNDMEAMQSVYGAPIENRQVGREVFYYYEDKDFSIVNLPVKERDLLLLNQAVHLLKQIQGFTIAEEIEEVVQRLEKRVKTNVEGRSVISFENPPPPKGIELLEDVFLAILHKKVLKIAYKSFKWASVQEWIIHPYFLKEYNNRWFLVGMYEETKTLGVYPLDRIEAVKVNALIYAENNELTADEYFKDVVGVTIPTNAVVEKIVIEFAAKRAPYVITKPIHLSQRVIEEKADGNFLIQIEIIPNPELESLLLSYGCDAQILEPLELKEKIKIIAEKLMSNYSLSKA